MALSVSFAIVNYETWGAFRQFATSLAPEASQTRVWVEKDWGLRYYLESEGALAVPRDQHLPWVMLWSRAARFPTDN